MIEHPRIQIDRNCKMYLQTEREITFEEETGFIETYLKEMENPKA